MTADPHAGHEHHPKAAARATESAARHAAHGAPGDPDAHAGHDKHAGHSVEMFRRKFFGTLLLSIPTLVWSPMIQHWLGYAAWGGPGASRWIPALFGTLVFPIAVYSHSQGCSITGGYVYRGRSIVSAHGRYFYGDYCNGTIWSLRTSKGKLTGAPRREPFTVGNLSSFGEDAAGELYATSTDGTVYKLAG